MLGTVSDFWRMMWEHRLETVVMLTKTKEGGKVHVCAIHIHNVSYVMIYIHVHVRTVQIKCML